MLRFYAMRFPGAQVMLGLSSMALWVRIPLAAPRSADAATQPADGARRAAPALAGVPLCAAESGAPVGLASRRLA